MKEIQKLDNRIEVIMTYEGKRYKLNPDGLSYLCGKVVILALILVVEVFGKR